MNLVKKINKKRSDLQKKINNVHIWSSISKDALNENYFNKEFLKKTYYDVPSKKKDKQIKRNTNDVQEILKNAIDIEFNYSIFTFLIAQVESFLLDIAFEILYHDHRRLKTNISGINHVKNVDISSIVDSMSLDEIIETIIQKELDNVFYASPKKQKEYFETVLSVDLDEEIWSNWFELKASRDIIVHNSGIINEIYLKKAGDLRRGDIDEQIFIDEDYLYKAVVTMKSMAGKISTCIKNSFKEGS